MDNAVFEVDIFPGKRGERPSARVGEDGQSDEPSPSERYPFARGDLKELARPKVSLRLLGPSRAPRRRPQDFVADSRVTPSHRTHRETWHERPTKHCWPSSSQTVVLSPSASVVNPRCGLRSRDQGRDLSNYRARRCQRPACRAWGARVAQVEFDRRRRTPALDASRQAHHRFAYSATVSLTACLTTPAVRKKSAV